MKFRELRRFVFGFCLLAGFMSLTGCHADPAKGSNEKWLSQVDTQAVICLLYTSIGDCKRVAKVIEATHDGYFAGANIR